MILIRVNLLNNNSTKIEKKSIGQVKLLPKKINCAFETVKCKNA